MFGRSLTGALRAGLPGLLLIATGPAPAQEAGLVKLAGTWEGPLKVNDQVALKIVFKVDATDPKAAKVTMDSPDQGAKGIVVDEAKLDGDAVTFGVKAIGGRYSGKLDAGGKAIKGTWSQGGGNLPLDLAKKDKDGAGKESAAGVPSETWEGPLSIPGGLKLRLVFRVFREEDGALRAVMDSPDQGAAVIKVATTAKRDGTLSFAVPVIAGEYSGKLDDAGAEAVGEWKQAGNTFPLTLKKVDRPTEVKRPQEPKPPFPYESEEVSYRNEKDDVTIAGTLTKPEGPGPFPVALFITGSGPQDRDESLMGHKPFAVLADALTRRGIAVLRVDDRGVGKSTGTHATATSRDFARDVAAGVAYLKGRSEFDPKRIGLVGHSEGGLIAPMVAAERDDVGFVVLMAGPGLPGDEILTMQGQLILKASGASDLQLKAQREAQSRLFRVVKEEADDKVATEKLKAAFKEVVHALPEEERKGLDEKTAEAQSKMITAPWFRFFLTYDPRPALAKVRCPVLAINGEKDLQVPPKENLAAIEEALKSGGNGRVTLKELTGLNHLFQASETGAPSEYATIEETFNPAALEAIGDWISGLPRE